MKKQYPSRSRHSYVTGLDCLKCLDGNTDEPLILDGKHRQALLRGFRLFIDEDLAGTPKGRDSLGNCVVEAAVENTELDCGDVRILFVANSVTDWHTSP